SSYLDLKRQGETVAESLDSERGCVYARKRGRQRPLGIAALEDKIVQRAVGEVLNAIWEQDFKGFWYVRTDPHPGGSGQGAASMMHWTRCLSGSRRRK